jgi:CheY-like chemotaxis protein
VQRTRKLTGASIVLLSAEPTLPPPMRSILIVSRPSPETTALAQRLEQDDYLVLTVDQVDDAVESLTALVPGAILIDLPVVQGRRLIRELRDRPHLRSIPRLLVTAGPLTARVPPVAAVFPRPVDPEHLIRALPALYPRTITGAAFMEPQPGQREERIQQALLHLQDPPPPVDLPAAIVVAASAGAVAVSARGHSRRSRRRPQQQAPQQSLAQPRLPAAGNGDVGDDLDLVLGQGGCELQADVFVAP